MYRQTSTTATHPTILPPPPCKEMHSNACWMRAGAGHPRHPVQTRFGSRRKAVLPNRQGRRQVIPHAWPPNLCAVVQSLVQKPPTDGLTPTGSSHPARSLCMPFRAATMCTRTARPPSRSPFKPCVPAHYRCTTMCVIIGAQGGRDSWLRREVNGSKKQKAQRQPCLPISYSPPTSPCVYACFGGGLGWTTEQGVPTCRCCGQPCLQDDRRPPAHVARRRRCRGWQVRIFDPRLIKRSSNIFGWDFSLISLGPPHVL